MQHASVKDRDFHSLWELNEYTHVTFVMHVNQISNVYKNRVRTFESHVAYSSYLERKN